jgi:pimeloyl-ACP methyl ester carboxylesterase
VLGRLRAEILAGPVPGPEASEIERYISHVMRAGLAVGIDGIWDDYLAFVRPWGFELDEISVPVLLMHGWGDQSVAISHGEWLAPRIPGCEARFLASEDHVSLLQNRMGEVHAWLKAQVAGIGDPR